MFVDEYTHILSEYRKNNFQNFDDDARPSSLNCFTPIINPNFITFFFFFARPPF